MEKLRAQPFLLGIWARLLLAFSTIAGITIVVATMALLIFQHSDNLFEAVTGKHVPAILQVAEFAEIGGEIIAVEQIRSNGVLLVGLMAQAATSGNAAQIDSLAALSSDAAALLRNDMKDISGDSSTLTLNQVLNDLFRLAEGEQSVFAVKTDCSAPCRKG